MCSWDDLQCLILKGVCGLEYRVVAICVKHNLLEAGANVGSFSISKKKQVGRMRLKGGEFMPGL